MYMQIRNGELVTVRVRERRSHTLGVGESYHEKADTRVGVAEWQWENGNRKVGESEPTRLLYSIRSLFSYSNSPTATRSFLFIYSDVLNDKTCLQMMKMMKLMKMMKVMRMRWINTRGDAGGNEGGLLVN